MKHTHVSTLTGITVLCYLIIGGFLLRTVATKLAGNGSPWGKGLSYIY